MASQRVGALDILEYLLLHPRLCIVLAFSIFMGTALAISAASSGSTTNRDRPSHVAALDMMPVAFEGKYSRSEIENEMRRAARAFDLSPNDTSYSRMASALISLRKETKVHEMALLRCARSMAERVDRSRTQLDFSAAASLCAVTLAR